MSITSRVKRFFYALGLNDEKAWNTTAWNLSGTKTSGEVVNETTALTYAAVWNAVTLISETLSTLPLNLYQKDGTSSRVADEESVYDVMHYQANRYMTASTFRQTLEVHALLKGNGFAEKVYNGVGDIVALWPIPPGKVLDIRMIDGELAYEISLDEGNRWFNRDKILHVTNMSMDGFVGIDPITVARKSLGIGMAMDTFGGKFFENDTHPDITVTYKNPVKDVSKIRAALRQSLDGLGDTNRILFLEEGMEMKALGMSPENSQFLESRVFQSGTEVARWFNLPPHKLKDLSKSSFNNIENEQLSYVTESILPRLIFREQQYRMQLLSERQRKTSFYWKHVVEGLLRANSKDRAEYYKLMIGASIMVPNEARAKEEMNPSTDPLANELWAPTGLIPLSKFDEYLAKNVGTAKIKDPDESGTEEKENETTE